MHLSFLKRSLAACLVAGVAGTAMAADLTVSAAASLTNAFKDIAQSYEAQHPGTMDKAQKEGLVHAGDRKDFVRNKLVLIVPTDAKTVPASLNDLTQAGFARVAIANPASVPVGRYSQTALEAAKLWPALQAKAINTQNVRQSLDYVARGEVDAGFVYATDAAIMKDKVKVAFVVPLETAILYPIAKTASSSNPADATSFIHYLATPAAQTILGKYGFAKP